MSDYTIVNLGDVENVAPKFQMPEGLDVRFPKQHLGCTAGGVGIEKLPPERPHAVRTQALASRRRST